MRHHAGQGHRPHRKTARAWRHGREVRAARRASRPQAGNLVRRRPTMNESAARFRRSVRPPSGAHPIRVAAHLRGRPAIEPSSKKAIGHRVSPSAQLRVSKWRCAQDAYTAPSCQQREAPMNYAYFLSVKLCGHSVKLCVRWLSCLFAVRLIALPRSAQALDLLPLAGVRIVPPPQWNAPAACPGRTSKRQLLGVALARKQARIHHGEGREPRSTGRSRNFGRFALRSVQAPREAHHLSLRGPPWLSAFSVVNPGLLACLPAMARMPRLRCQRTLITPSNDG